MRQATLLILNATATFARMAVNIGIGLYTTRVLLQYLGKTDFGLVMAISASVSIFTILSITVRTSIGRQMGLATGQGSQKKKRDIFASAQLLLLLCGMIISILSLLISTPLLANLTIPAERLDASTTVFYFTAMNLVLMVFFTAHELALVSEQEIVIVSIFQVLDALFKALSALALIYVEDDKMVSYIIILTALNFVMLSARALVCMWKLPYVRVSPLRYDAVDMKEVFSFSRWTAMHTAANYLRQDGVVILVNVGFGAVWNAMFAVGQQVGTYLRNFAMSLEAVVLPASLKSEGSDNRQNAVRIAFTGEKYTLILLSFIAIPFFFEATPLITLWLGEGSFEPSMAVFAQLLIVLSLMNITTRCHSLVLFAQGDYGVYSFVQLLVAIATLVTASILVFSYQLPAERLPWVMIFGALGLNVFRILHVQDRLNIPVPYWFHNVLWPLLWSTLPPIALVFVSQSLFLEVSFRPLLTVFVYAVTAIPFVWFKGMSLEERNYVVNLLLPKSAAD